MILDPDAAARVEAAFDAAQLKTRAPLVCVLAGASTSLDAEFLLGACDPRARDAAAAAAVHRAFRPPHLRCPAACRHSGRGRRLRCRRCGAGWSPSAWARSAGHRAALAQFVLRGIDRSRCGALIYVSLAEHYIRIVPAEDAAKAVSHERWQAAVDEALGPLAAGETEAALIGLAERCGDLLAGPFPPGEPVDPARQRFHIV